MHGLIKPPRIILLPYEHACTVWLLITSSLRAIPIFLACIEKHGIGLGMRLLIKLRCAWSQGDKLNIIGEFD